MSFSVSTSATTHTSDEQLLARFVSGDVESLGELARRHEAALVGLARGLLGGREDRARDVVQSAWVKVIRYAASFDGRASFKTWVYRIVINLCHDQRTADATRRAISLDAGVQGAGSIASNREAEPAASLNGTAPAQHADTEDLSALRTAVEALPAAQRTIIILGYHHDLTLTQIADILDLPVGTVKSRLHAALAALRTRLGPARAALGAEAAGTSRTRISQGDTP